MNLLKYIEYLRTNIKTLRNILMGFLAVLILFDLVIPRDAHHSHYFIDRIRAYWTIFGVVGCFLLIKIGKGIAHLFLSKDEDFYE
jgi:hypothetical protein